MKLVVTLPADAAIEFLDGFRYYERLRKARRSKSASTAAAKSLRALYIGIEKALKEALHEVNPYLLIDRIDQRLLLAISKDLRASTSTSLLACRVPFESPSLLRTWEMVKALRGGDLEDDLIDSFDRGLKQFVDARNRCQHGELSSEATEIIAIIEQVLQGIRPVLIPLCPKFARELSSRSAQIEARLQAIEQKIDASWSVLLKFLKENGPLKLETSVAFTQNGPSRDIVVIIRDVQHPIPVQITLLPKVPADGVSGIFGHFLTPEEARQREIQRRIPHPKLDPQIESAVLTTGAPVQGHKVLETGSLSCPPEWGWITFHLPGMKRARLTVQVFLMNLKFSFGSAESSIGKIEGILLGPRDRSDDIPFIGITGELVFQKELAGGPTGDDTDFPDGFTLRSTTAMIRLHAGNSTVKAPGSS